MPAVTTLGGATAAAPAIGAPAIGAPPIGAPATGGFRLVATKFGEFKSGRLLDATIGGAPAAAVELPANSIPLCFKNAKSTSAPAIPRPIAIPLPAPLPPLPGRIAPPIIPFDLNVGAELTEG